MTLTINMKNKIKYIPISPVNLLMKRFRKDFSDNVVVGFGIVDASGFTLYAGPRQKAFQCSTIISPGEIARIICKNTDINLVWFYKGQFSATLSTVDMDTVTHMHNVLKKLYVFVFNVHGVMQMFTTKQKAP